MALHDETVNETVVLDVVEHARSVLERGDEEVRGDACALLGIGTDEWAACRAELVEQTQEAEEWLQREQALRSIDGVAPLDSDHGPEFIPSHPTLALVQSAIEEDLDTTSSRRFLRRDPNGCLSCIRSCSQPASYFSLQNRHWRLTALDSGYVNHNFNAPQLEWFGAQVGGARRTILLTHHHLFSPFRKRGDLLEERLDPFIARNEIFAWFWGHDHHLIEFEEYRHVRCRCIGHGSLPYVPPDRRRMRNDVPIGRMETRPSPLASSRGMHGFAPLTFDGAVVSVDYVDEMGGVAWSERWD